MILRNRLSMTGFGFFVLAVGVLFGRLPAARAQNPPTSILLHIGPVAGENACGQVPDSPASVVTSAPANPDGSASYYVYLLGTPVYTASGSTGLAGMQVGITYEENTPGHPGLAVHSWELCSSGLYFPGEGWPAPDTGVRITWALSDECNQPPLIPAGYFYVTAYGSSVMAIEGYPSDGTVKVADCNVDLFDVDVDAARVGWVSMGNAAIGSNSAGCNPVLEPCLSTTSVEPSTWGRVKERYWNPRRP